MNERDAFEQDIIFSIITNLHQLQLQNETRFIKCAQLYCDGRDWSD